jgi:glucose/arabinose dehydrogenase
MRKLIYAIIALALFNNVQAQTPPSLTLTQFAQGFSIPVGIEHCGDSRLFIVQQRGLIRILNANGSINSTAFLDITSLVSSSGNERGLLGLAFHPDYATNGYFYVNYTRSSDGATRVSRFSVNPADPNDALENSELNLLTIAQPYSNHNGGQIRFGPDGYLYIGMGDGGSADDPNGNGQSTTTLLGKMLRIDVDNGSPYGIPASNPYAGMTNPKPEIWATGMRNPWRFNFDRCTGDLWIGDVGQDYYEEVDFQPASSTGGENYGWRCREGLHECPTCNTSGCATTGFTDPIYEYQHTNPNGCSISGGYVYRGGIYGGMFGWYLFTDYCSGRIWGSYPNGSGGFTTSVLTTNTTITNNLSTFGEDYVGELYLAGQSNGRIYKISVSTCAAVAYICGGDVTICEGETALLAATAGEGNSYQWQLDGNDIPGAESDTYLATADGVYRITVTRALNCFAESNEITVTVLPTPAASFSGLNSNYCVNYSPSTLSGSPAGGTFSGPGVSGNTFNPLTAGEGTHDIVYSYTDNNGCTDTETLTTTVNPCTSIDEAVLDNMNLYPNPAENLLNIEFYVSGKMDVVMNIYNATGQLVKAEQNSFAGGMNKVQTDISALAAGVYVAELQGLSGKEQRRFVVSR